MEVFCSQPPEVMNYISNTNSEAVSPNAGYKEESEVSTKVGGPSAVTTALIVTAVLLVCAICGGLILTKVVKRCKNKPTTPEYDDVYAPRASDVSIHSYAEVGAGPSYITVHTYADVGKRPSYLSVQSNADVGSDSYNTT
jgi:hypothetical protein